ncbi:hypothetical protein ACWDR9_09995 [Streptosporangium sandarakinum]
MDVGRKRLDHLRNDLRVTLTVLDGGNWYTHVSIIGRVVEIRDDEDLSDIDRLSIHYGGNPYPRRDRKRVSAWIEIDRSLLALEELYETGVWVDRKVLSQGAVDWQRHALDRLFGADPALDSNIYREMGAMSSAANVAAARAANLDSTYM